jgi:hypothetical protein
LLICSAGAAQEDDPRWSLQYLIEIDAEQTVLGQTYQPRTQELALDYRVDSGARVGWRHEFVAVDLPAVNGVAPDTNGFLHRTGPTWVKESPERILQFELRFAVSSNALNHPSDLGGQDLSVLAAIEQRVAAHGLTAWWLSLHADDRFGTTRVYPGVQLQWLPTKETDLRLGFPDSSLRWSGSQRLRSEVLVGPDGGKWRVRDTDVQRQSDVRMRSWSAIWITQWQAFDALALEFRIGRHFATDLRYQLQDGSSAFVEIPDTNFLGLSASVRF